MTRNILSYTMVFPFYLYSCICVVIFKVTSGERCLAETFGKMAYGMFNQTLNLNDKT